MAFLVGCASSSQTPPAARISFSYHPFTVDPRKGTDPVTTALCLMLYEGLFHLEEDGTLSNAIAKGLEISEDRRTYTFFLRPSMWSDGSPLTAYHFAEGWKKQLSPTFTSRNAHFLYPILNAEEVKEGKAPMESLGITPLDELTLQVTLKHPTPYFLELLAHPIFFPVPYNGDEVPYPTEGGELLTNGPFMLESWKNEDRITLIKNPYYWEAEAVELERIQALIISEESTALKLFEKGKLDYIGGLISPLPLDAIASLREEGKIFEKPGGGTAFATFNLHRYPFNNLHIRKAFAYAIHRQAIVENVTQMWDDPATGLVPPHLKRAAITFFNDHAAALARKHFMLGLEELGISKEEFPPIIYDYFSSELQRGLAVALQSYWREVLGIEVSLQAQELRVHLQKLTSGDFMIAQMSWIAQYSDPMCFLERFLSKKQYRNYGGWEHPTYQALLTASNKVPEKERKVLLEEAEKLLIDEMPILPLYHYHSVYLKSPRLKGLEVSPIGNLSLKRATVK
ncbi:MAG: peptide ABC transporter substrate-binding protein [Chlamydiia bacterium]|nr:peptide ABC transporter substrate-binding protein [Chlamydiia bacterium]